MPRMSQTEREQHMRSAPEHFVSRIDPVARARSRQIADEMLRTAEELTPADAVRVAQTLLVHLVASNAINYAEFQSAQAVEKYVGRAITALRGLALS